MIYIDISEVNSEFLEKRFYFDLDNETHGTLRSLKKLEFSIFGYVNSNDFNRQFIEYLDGKVFSLNEEYYLFSTGQYGENEILVKLQKI